ncbi:unnamed protein product [Auanema sp. JU1783]|nr:unnamed protein product [Auanema sp. JU1783]
MLMVLCHSLENIQDGPVLREKVERLLLGVRSDSRAARDLYQQFEEHSRSHMVDCTCVEDIREDAIRRCEQLAEGRRDHYTLKDLITHLVLSRGLTNSTFELCMDEFQREFDYFYEEGMDHVEGILTLIDLTKDDTLKLDRVRSQLRIRF